MRILVADDDRATVETQALILQRRGFVVVTCTQGKDVLPLLEKHRPDVLLLDLVMPEMTGFDVALQLKENPDLRPRLLVALTGFDDDAAREKTARAGFDYHLAKPLKLFELLAILATAFPDAEAI